MTCAVLTPARGTAFAISGTEAAFRTALQDPKHPEPAGLQNASGGPAGRRYAVYRNNVAVSLREALEAGFPATRALIGAERFAIVARAFAAAHPPQDPVMALYGAGLPAFLAAFEPLQSIGYLPDVARLEYARRQSYHAADARPLTGADLQAIAPDALPHCRFGLAPAVQILRSAWPVYAIWRFATEGGPKPAAGAQTVLIGRPAYDPVVRLLPDGAAGFLAMLGQGLPFGAALERAGPALDLTTTLTCALDCGALTAR